MRAPAAITVLLLAVPLAGCVGLGGAGAECSAQHAYADRLVLEQEGLYEAAAEAQRAANRSPAAQWARHAQGAWSGTRGAVETVHADGRVHGSYVAAPADDPSLRVRDSALADYGPLWLDEIVWHPEGPPEPGGERAISYEAPANPKADPTFSMAFRGSNLSKAEAADHVGTLHDTLFPDTDYAPLEDGDFSEAWTRTYQRHPPVPARADALLAQLVDAGELRARQAPFEGLAFPHTLGTLHLEGQDVEPYHGEIRLLLTHDVRAIAVDADPPIALEVTPTDRARVSNLGSAPLGAEDLTETAREALADVDGLPELALDEARYEEGGRASTTVQGSCSATDALGEPLDANR